MYISALSCSCLLENRDALLYLTCSWVQETKSLKIPKGGNLKS